MSNQTTSRILMVRPAHFGFNEETAESNAFQTLDKSLHEEEIQQKALQEFDNFVSLLRGNGVDILVFEDTPEPVKPDAVFPNNWVTFHADGTVMTYPMLSKVRRLERRQDMLDDLSASFRISRKIHLEEYEHVGKILEGTGSMILDRKNKLVYACLSPRTSAELLDHFCDLLGYEAVAFHAVDGEGKEIYHTNVMMALGETFVVICMESVPDPVENERLVQKFRETGKDIIEISYDQMMHFAGNMLQVRGQDDQPLLVMSGQAYRSLTQDQVQHIEKHTRILSADIPTIETYGGGSVRCMMAEVFLPEL